MRTLLCSLSLVGLLVGSVAAGPAAAASDLDQQVDAADQACVTGATEREAYLRSHQEAVRGQPADSAVWIDFSQHLGEYRNFTAACSSQLRGFYSQLVGKPGEGHRTARLYRLIFDFGPGDRDRADDWQAILDHKH